MSHVTLQIITEWPGFSSKNYTKLQNDLALAAKITDNYRMVWL